MKAKRELWSSVIAGLMFLALIAVGLWADWRYHEAVYGDGSCMFARCVKVVR